MAAFIMAAIGVAVAVIGAEDMDTAASASGRTMASTAALTMTTTMATITPTAIGDADAAIARTIERSINTVGRAPHREPFSI
jgi:hypothetical protein